MKRLFVIISLIPCISFGQLIDELPKDENGNLSYTEVIQQEGTMAELYLRAKKCFVDIFKSANDVIQLDDKDTGTIVGKGFSIIYHRIPLNPPVELQLWYTLKIQCKDGRFKYEINNIYFQYAGRTSPPSEVFDKSVYYKKNGEPRPAYENRKNEMTKKINELIDSIKSKMNTQTKKDDW